MSIKRLNWPAAILSATLGLMSGAPAGAGEIGWIEDFALAADRTAALEQLIPGTDEYFYYHCLQLQNTEQWDKADALLKSWLELRGWTPRPALEIQNRQALLTYQRNPQRTLDLLRQRLDLRFNHEREQLHQKPNLPLKLAPELLAPERLDRETFANHLNTLEGFEDAALERLLTSQLSPNQWRQLLSRLERPDHAGLVKRIIDDLQHEGSGGFGSLPIHGRLLLAQLDDCLQAKPDLRNQTRFVNAYLLRQHPSDDVNWRQDRAAQAGYLDRLWSFVKTLDPAHNSLKAHVLYHRLALDRSLGKYDAERLLEYLRLPKRVSYIEPKYLEKTERRQGAANLQQDFSAVTMLSVVGDDEPLVRSYLAELLLDAPDAKRFAPYVDDRYLTRLFAETKIVHGLGNPEQWSALLPPAAYQQLKERIDLDFASTNKTEFGVDEAVGLDLDVKNVETLIVKVFEINTQNFYRQNLREIGTDVNLDGLVANEEQTWTYRDPPLRRVRRHFDFPALNKRGVYVIDFIGNGKASRALVQKGRLRHLVRSSVGGQAFTILNEQNQPLPAATLWLAGVHYAPDKDGVILVPYSHQPGRQAVVLSWEGFSSLDHFEQQNERFDFTAAMVVDREQLIARREAKLLIRPRLLVSGAAVSIAALSDVTLSITSTDLDDVSTTKEVTDLRLFDDRETIYAIQVPQRLANIRFQLHAKTQSYSQNKKIELADEQQFQLNEIDRADKTADLHFTRFGDDYVVELLGKTGEAKADRAVNFALKMRDYTQPVDVSLQTDAGGRIVLGPLNGVLTVTATGPQGVCHIWPLRRDAHTYPSNLHGEAGQPIEIPYLGARDKPERDEVSLLEQRGEAFVADRFHHISLDRGLLKLEKLPPGDYSLLLKRQHAHVRLRVAAGPARDGYALGDFRQLELRNRRPLQIERPKVSDQTVRVQLQNATPFARVHVFATRFEPSYPTYELLSRVAPLEPAGQQTYRADSRYIAGRDIGDEYRYIIDRKYARKFPGNMLERPSLLLNPWAIRDTQSVHQEAQGGEQFGAAPGAAGAQSGHPFPPMEPANHLERGLTDFANLDFLADSSLVAVNLAPDKNGVIELQRADLGPHQELLIVAVDPQNTASRIVTLPAPRDEALDLRLAKSLDPQQHFTQQKQVTILPAGGRLVVNDITSARLEAYDTLGRVFALYAALQPHAALADFGFVRDWVSLKPEQKREQYLKHACHELHFFLARHDPEFFKTAIRPYLANKKEQQFLDRWLLGENLDEYAQSWQFEQLNAFERILLGQRLAGDRESIRHLIRDQVDLLPPDADRLNYLFETALKGSALETTDRFEVRGVELDPTTLSVEAVAAAPVDAAEVNMGSAGGAPANKPAAPAPARADKIERRKAATRAEGRMAGKGQYAKKDAAAAGLALSDAALDFRMSERDLDRAKSVQQYFRKLDKTMEWVESNYYKLPLDQQTAALIAANAFWRDVATHDPAQPFFSPHLAEATHSFPEMLMALALLDLPFEAGQHQTEFQGTRMTLTAASPMVVYHEQIQPAAKVAEHAPILISENFFRHGDRHRLVNGEQVDNFVTEEFLVDTVYGCQVVVTNPTSSKQKLDVLLQIPAGSLPVLNTQPTRSKHVDLEPYHTATLEYEFYFPSPGKFAHYGAHVASGGEVLAFAAPFTLHVVPELTNIDRQSWDYISQHGSNAEVIDYLKQQNLLAVQLDRLAWRMRDRAFFEHAIGVLAARHVYNHTLWSYGVLHNHVPTIRQFLQFADGFVASCGEWLDSPLLVIEPITRKLYEQMDYQPLVNARSGPLGRHRQILNDRFLSQYQRLLKILSYRRQPNDVELMTITYYLLLQDRVEPALEFFGRVNPERLETRLQYDYFTAYLAFSRSQPQQARQIATKYAAYPVERWRLAFANIANQADDIGRPEIMVADSADREQQQTNAAASTPAFDFTVEAKQVKLHYQNIAEARVNYYVMDVELLFSGNPFVQGESKQFSYIMPNQSQVVKLPAKRADFEFPLPAQLTHSNVLVEIVAGGLTQTQAYYSNSLKIQLIENYGQAQVSQAQPARPLAKVYVKVFARRQDGSVHFYKDGYTDLRGRFDYASLSDNELDVVERFSLLFISEEDGAVVREAKPPKR